MADVLCEGWKELPIKWRSLPYWVVKRYFGHSRRFRSELNDEAVVGLVDAARHYNPDYRTKSGKPVQFNTYATNVIWMRCKKLVDRLNRVDRCCDRLSSEMLEDSEIGHLLATERERINAQRAGWRVDDLLSRTKLTDNQRLAIEYKFFRNYTINQMAAEFKVRRETVSRWLINAIDSLRATGDEYATT